MEEKKKYPPGRPKKGELRPKKESKENPHGLGLPRPDRWICGPDEYKHSMYLPWLRAKAQCNFRDEEFTLSFDEYYELWRDHWPERGRKGDQKCMSRKDPEGAWSKDNSEIITRHEHLIRQGFIRRGAKYKMTGKYATGRPRKTAVRVKKIVQPPSDASLFDRYYKGVK